MLNRLARAAGFTNTEIKALVFLLVVFLCGLTFKYLFLTEPAVLMRFDYSVSDSMFNSAGSPEKEMITRAGNKDVDYKQEVLDFNKQNFTVKKRTDLLKEKSINLNKAQLNDLIMLPGIGEATADNILRYRESIGRFRKIEELMNVKRIGEKRFNQIKKYVFID